VWRFFKKARSRFSGKRPDGESFTELVKRITEPLRKKKLSEFAGLIKDEKFAKAALEIRHLKSTRLNKVKL